MSSFRLPWAYAQKIVWRITGQLLAYIPLLISRNSCPEIDLKCCRHFFILMTLLNKFPIGKKDMIPYLKLKASLTYVIAIDEKNGKI